MSFSKPNASAATRTKNRTPNDRTHASGMCSVCVDECPGLCEIGKSAFRASENLYPQPFGTITAGADKDYPVDFSHLNIMGTAVGAVGIEANSDKAIFENVNAETRLGKDKGIKLKLPIMIPGLGSTNVAKTHWDGIAVGSAISGTGLTIGENVGGMDVNTKLENGKIVHCPDIEYRVKTFQTWQQDGYGVIVMQENVEDSRLGVLEYGINKLGVQAVEMKWGQGAKDIGGEVKINSLEKARLLRDRGYIVLPDPYDNTVASLFGKAFKEFERHSRVGMVNEEAFVKRVKELRKAGAKYIFLKTGAYRPADLARAVRYCSVAGVDVLTVDGAGGGTGMSPWHMMNEWGVPTLYIASLTYNYVHKLASKGQYVPDIILAGGFAFEDDIFKAMALGAPYVKAVGMARSPLCAAHVGKLIAEQIKKNDIDKTIEPYGKTMEEIFVLASRAKRLFGTNGREVPSGAIGVYSYYQRLSQGLRQLMCGARKFALEYLTRDDIVTLTREAAEVTGIKYIMDADIEEAEQILMGKEKPSKPVAKGKPKVSSKPVTKGKGKAKK
ncbi:MAG: FMN-binding glutamate synthase family protein [Candidatus Brocadia sp. AMX2]|uniref:Glutamate synthase n=1 Tax=Candidatus Brocadia sinica JPN1 TaxID=1197129 RepID=A0ABQ0JUZ1_9BACT|nr:MULTISPECIES: FMN-binding glutamate synthase family protein [Brocadia]MBC6933367.1 FMN-binding glutamate synthase family protein [Candidatus Brocadia sp.]MBL1169659.1 FMN-binding glutamate synthase family protein [Candidatus Brocadia sp. AMX1]NOG41603.1 FMN-binding glutamate synthase family protein [Planctomycetota bacterium]GIK13943.1 MAG: FMN-binding glutamate synthase family protein [Candidatus Brocadia sinica]KAA0244426.1 MAG: FMN-binding glutamate synthase family protein [Candidatus Br